MSRHSKKEIERCERIASKMTVENQTQGSLAAPPGSAAGETWGHFRKANGKLKACILVSGRGVLKVKYVERGQALVCYIAESEFMPMQQPNDQAQPSRTERVKQPEP